MSDIQVRQKVFEECFDYYAVVNRESGIVQPLCAEAHRMERD
jgi:hypothetical protein